MPSPVARHRARPDDAPPCAFALPPGRFPHPRVRGRLATGDAAGTAKRLSVSVPCLPPARRRGGGSGRIRGPGGR